MIWLALTLLAFTLVVGVRNQLVYNFQGHLIDAIDKAAKADTQDGCDWRWRYAVYDRVTYWRMVFQFWRRLKSFYHDYDFINPEVRLVAACELSCTEPLEEEERQEEAAPQGRLKNLPPLWLLLLTLVVLVGSVFQWNSNQRLVERFEKAADQITHNDLTLADKWSQTANKVNDLERRADDELPNPVRIEE